MFCPNRECVHFVETGAPAEYPHGIETCPKCGTLLVAEAPVVPNSEAAKARVSIRSDIQVEILAELRRTRRLNVWISVGFLAVVILVVAVGEFAKRSRQVPAPAQASSSDSWDVVFDLVRAGRIDEALRMAQAAHSLAPQYYYTNVSLSYVNLAKGDVRHAEEYAEKAYRLLPSEENGRYLAALHKRLAMEAAAPKPNQGAR